MSEQTPEHDAGLTPEAAGPSLSCRSLLPWNRASAPLTAEQSITANLWLPHPEGSMEWARSSLGDQELAVQL